MTLPNLVFFHESVEPHEVWIIWPIHGPIDHNLVKSVRDLFVESVPGGVDPDVEVREWHVKS